MISSVTKARFASAIGVAAASLVAPAAAAAPLLWTLDAIFVESPATPTGLARVTGTFNYDAATGIYSDFLVNVRPLVLSQFVVNPSGSLAPSNTTVGPGSSPTLLSLTYSVNTFDPSRPEEDYLRANGGLALGFAAPLTEAGGFVALVGGSWSLDYTLVEPLSPGNNSSGYDGQVPASGSVRASAVAVAVPEPARLGLAVMTLGLLAALALGATRQRAAVSWA